MEDKTYIGDSVYASCDGYHIILETINDGVNASNRIALEPSVMDALKRYESDLRIKASGGTQ